MSSKMAETLQEVNMKLEIKQKLKEDEVSHPHPDSQTLKHSNSLLE